MTSSVPSATRRPLVLVHGLWDTPRLFRRLERQLEAHAFPLLVPHLPHRLGLAAAKRLPHRVLYVVAYEQHTAPRAAERFVRGRGDDVRVRERVVEQARGNEARRVRHVHP